MSLPGAAPRPANQKEWEVQSFRHFLIKSELTPRIQCRLKFGFVIMGQRRLQDFPACPTKFFKHLVRGHFADEDKKRRRLRLETGSKILHELIVDPNIAQSTGDCSGTCANDSPKDRIQENQTNQAPQNPPPVAPIAVRGNA